MRGNSESAKEKISKRKAEEKPKKSNAEAQSAQRTEIENERLHLAEMGRSSAAPLAGDRAQA